MAVVERHAIRAKGAVGGSAQAVRAGQDRITAGHPTVVEDVVRGGREGGSEVAESVQVGLGEARPVPGLELPSEVAVLKKRPSLRGNPLLSAVVL